MKSIYGDRRSLKSRKTLVSGVGVIGHVTYFDPDSGELVLEDDEGPNGNMLFHGTSKRDAREKLFARVARENVRWLST